MLATWNLKTVDSGVSVTYQNLVSGQDMDCGVTDVDASTLIDFMVWEGGGGAEVVFIDGNYALHLMPAQSDFPGAYAFVDRHFPDSYRLHYGSLWA